MGAKEASCLPAWLAAAALAGAQPIYPATPDWVSTDRPVSTGAALVDLDGDGWLDLVVANGNDMARQRVAVYTNRGDGTFPPTPSWQSADVQYNGHLDVADVDGDGWPDVAVATLGSFSTVGPIARIYRNNAGTLSSTPSWSSPIVGNAFGLAFGDVNNDGRPDLAVGTGWAYDPQNFYRNYVFVNVGGVLESVPSWVSDDSWHYQGVVWVDADDDGWLDLAAAAAGTRSRLYRNLGGVLETTASWSVTDATSQDGIMVTAGDVTGDGWPELFLADNNQLAGGSGRLRQYAGGPAGFASVADWTYAEGYCSAVALADVDADGRLDLATGAWWDRTRLFLNGGGGFGATPAWSSGVTSVVEKLVFGDIDKNGLRPVQRRFTGVPPGRRLFRLPHQPVQAVQAVVVDGQALGPGQYVLSREHGWLTVGQDVAAELRVEYTVSCKLDLAVTNWDDTVGNFVYYSRLLVPGDANCDGRADFDDIDPFVMLLTGAYGEHYPDCDGAVSCDFDASGAVDFDDIDPFVAALSG